MHASWIFKPKHGKEIYCKVIQRFADHYLDWYNNGISCHTAELKNGWVELQAVADDAGNMEYYSEMCFTDNPLTGEDLTEHMMILLVESGVATNVNEDSKESPVYSLEERDMCEVVAALSELDTNVYSPYGAKCWVYPVGSGMPKTVDMLDALLTLQAA